MGYEKMSLMAFESGAAYGFVVLLVGGGLLWGGFKFKWHPRVRAICTCFVVGGSLFAFVQLMSRFDNLGIVNKEDRDPGFLTYLFLVFVLYIFGGVLNLKERGKK
jgi:hypothetical protein